IPINRFFDPMLALPADSPLSPPEEGYFDCGLIQPSSRLTYQKFHDYFDATEVCVVKRAMRTDDFTTMINLMEGYNHYAHFIKDSIPNHPDYAYMKDEAIRGRISLPR